MAGLAEILEENQRLRERAAGLEVSLADKDSALADKDSALADKDATIEVLRQAADDLAKQLELLRLSASGPRSERYIPPDQTYFDFPGDIPPPPRAPVLEDEDDAPALKPKKNGKPRRRSRSSLEHLPAKPVHCAADPDATCAGCGGPLRVIGTADSTRLEWVPGHFVRHDVRRDKCACPNCPEEGVLTVPSPYALDRALCGNSLLAKVISDKFLDHLPLNRQAKRFGRLGMPLATSTLSGWVCAVAGLLGVVASAVRTELFAGGFLQGDDTGSPVQDAGNGQLRKGRLWVFTDQQQAFYAFTPTKEGEHPVRLLDGYAGELFLADAGSEFNAAVRVHGLERAGCWSHVRSKFYAALVHDPVDAQLVLGTLHDLFAIERTIWGDAPDAVKAARHEHSKPLIDGFFAWAQARSSTVRPASALGKALTYARNQEVPLRLFLEHGELPFHNNLSELMLRQAVVGRKNWLFARSEGGAEAAATLYTLVQSCMLQGIDPHAYLVDVLRVLPDWPSNRVGELTPKQWRLARAGPP